jgi:hypothetical protein
MLYEQRKHHYLVQAVIAEIHRRMHTPTVLPILSLLSSVL